MFAMFDNCHSGTILDLKYKYENNKNIITNSNYRETKGNVILVSGCKDNQVSYDASINNQFNGVLTWVIINVLENNENITWASLLKKAREIIAMNKFDQIPQLSCGTNVDLDTLNVFI
jgi:alkyl hydroperoxide reductase subunit AhpF